MKKSRKLGPYHMTIELVSDLTKNVISFYVITPKKTIQIYGIDFENDTKAAERFYQDEIEDFK